MRWGCADWWDETWVDDYLARTYVSSCFVSACPQVTTDPSPMVNETLSTALYRPPAMTGLGR
jgi:hypothetical protein